MLMILKSKKGIKEPSEGKGQVIRQSKRDEKVDKYLRKLHSKGD